ncbi:MAG TPA: hypothetical protein VGP72_09490 [Planctomycetota bacterium]|jgi:cytochrome c-type biogenesis protein CcmH/NrfF
MQRKKIAICAVAVAALAALLLYQYARARSLQQELQTANAQITSLRQQIEEAAKKPGLNDLDAKVLELSQPGTTAEQVIGRLGDPPKYVWGDAILTKGHLPETYVLWYSDSVMALISKGMLVEIRNEGIAEFSYRQLRNGSSLEDVIKVCGLPDNVIVGQPNKFLPRTLYKDIDGREGYCYYCRPDQHVRLFFRDYRLCALYVTAEDGTSGKNKTGATRQAGEF